MSITPEQAAKLISDYLILGMHHSTKEAQAVITNIIKNGEVLTETNQSILLNQNEQ